MHVEWRFSKDETFCVNFVTQCFYNFHFVYGGISAALRDSGQDQQVDEVKE